MNMPELSKDIIPDAMEVTSTATPEYFEASPTIFPACLEPLMVD